MRTMQYARQGSGKIRIGVPAMYLGLVGYHTLFADVGFRRQRMQQLRREEMEAVHNDLMRVTEKQRYNRRSRQDYCGEMDIRMSERKK